MANLLKVLYEVVWTEGRVPKQHRQGLRMVMLRTRVITEALHELLSVIGKLFCKKSRSNQTSEWALQEGQAGFREKSSCVYNIFTLNEIIQGRNSEGNHTCAFSEMAFDTVHS